MFAKDPASTSGWDNPHHGGRIAYTTGASMKREIILNVTFLFVVLPACLAQTTTSAPSTNKTDSKLQTKQEKKAAKDNAKTTKKPATVADAPSQEAAYALSRSSEAPKQTPPPK
jgi:hypothetical protein